MERSDAELIRRIDFAGVKHMCFTRDGKLLVGSTLNSLHVYDPSTGKELYRLCEPSDKVELAWVHSSRVGRLVVARFASEDAKKEQWRQRVWDQDTGRELDSNSWQADSEAEDSASRFNHDTGFNLVGTFDGKTISTTQRAIQVKDAASGKLLRTVHAHGAGISCWAITPDHKHLITGGEDRLIKIHDLTKLLTEDESIE